MVSSLGVGSLTLSHWNTVSLSPSLTGGASSSRVASSPALTNSISLNSLSPGTTIPISLSSVRLQVPSFVSSASLRLSSESISSATPHISSTPSFTSLDQTISTAGGSSPYSSAQSTPLSKSSSARSDRNSIMVSPSISTSATAGNKSSLASSAKSTIPTSTSKALNTTDTASEDQEPTPSLTSKSSSDTTSPTSNGGDVTTTTSSATESHAITSTATQIAIPSHKTESGSAATTSSSVQGGTEGSGATGPSNSPVASRPSSAVSFTPGVDGSEAPPIPQTSSRSPVTTSTITDKPETTLSTPVFLTVTDAQNHTTISEPPVFTSVEVTISNGEQVSVTHVIANPTGIWGVNEATSSHGFFSNSGAVAGVFLVVGLIIAAIFAGIFFYFRRRGRAPVFIESISRPLPMPDDPFEDPRTLLPPSEMTYASGHVDRTLVITGAATPHPTPSHSPFDSDLDHGSPRSSEARPSSEHLHSLGLAGIGTGGGYGDSSQSSLHSRSRQPSQRGSVGLAITTDVDQDSGSSVKREPSSAQSSPSIYPPSLSTLSGEDNHSLVDVPLGNSSGATRFTNTSSTRLSSPTTRKPVPPHDFLEPVAPVPRSPQQQQAEQTSPPVIPPRSPLRRNSTVTSRSRSPPSRLTSIQTQLKNPELASTVLRPYEPLTPPTSLASLSPAGSSLGHGTLAPISPADAIAATNPFSDAHAQQISHAEVITAFPMTRSGNKRETFYTRTRGSQRQPSVEWRQHD